MKPELEKKWLGKLTRLNPASGRGQCRGKAPHKPLLLLCLVDMAEAGEPTGLSCLTTDGAAIVDAAHIESWAASENDDVQNGLALCKNAHWMFDEGLWSVESAECRMQSEWKIVVAAQRFTENGPEALRLQPYGGRLLQFADGVTLRPNPEYFARHRAFHNLR